MGWWVMLLDLQPLDWYYSLYVPFSLYVFQRTFYHQKYVFKSVQVRWNIPFSALVPIYGKFYNATEYIIETVT